MVQGVGIGVWFAAHRGISSGVEGQRLSGRMALGRSHIAQLDVGSVFRTCTVAKYCIAVALLRPRSLVLRLTERSRASLPSSERSAQTRSWRLANVHVTTLPHPSIGPRGAYPLERRRTTATTSRSYRTALPFRIGAAMRGLWAGSRPSNGACPPARPSETSNS